MLYTQRLVSIWNAGGPADVVVPAGKRFIVMTLVAQSGSVAPLGVSLSVPGIASLGWIAISAVNAGQVLTNLRAVANAGETMRLGVTAVCYASAFGYVLDAA